MHDQLTAQEYRQKRRRQNDLLVDNAELLLAIAERYSRRQEFRARLGRWLVKAIPLASAIAVGVAASGDWIVRLWTGRGGR